MQTPFTTKVTMSQCTLGKGEAMSLNHDGVVLILREDAISRRKYDAALAGAPIGGCRWERKKRKKNKKDRCEAESMSAPSMCSACQGCCAPTGQVLHLVLGLVRAARADCWRQPFRFPLLRDCLRGSLLIARPRLCALRGCHRRPRHGRRLQGSVRDRRGLGQYVGGS